MRISYFLSGFGEESGFPPALAAALQRDLPRRDTLLLIASSPGGYEKTDRYKNGVIRWFEKAGMVFETCLLLDDRMDGAQALAAIHSASCIFLMGGDTLAQFAFLQESGLTHALKNTGAVVAGMSAGAINMAVDSLCTKDRFNAQTTLYKGIGRADITMEPHFSMENSPLMEELKQLSMDRTIYALCDGSAITVRGGEVLFLGEIYRIRGGQVERLGV